ncbi:proline-rich receptor-like protein kinase PERK9 [Ischnura elegans]|uniref:proline-rich receptor-like protein kinase PERK9 n=1 Tax=Ischnura elegans TaxID=197161 RepID=UPI001ED8B613|nr:proline-rich receptor-like protein kinase PERK9 [Ischnura elegans]
MAEVWNGSRNEVNFCLAPYYWGYAEDDSPSDMSFDDLVSALFNEAEALDLARRLPSHSPPPPLIPIPQIGRVEALDLTRRSSSHSPPPPLIPISRMGRSYDEETSSLPSTASAASGRSTPPPPISRLSRPSTTQPSPPRPTTQPATSPSLLAVQPPTSPAPQPTSQPLTSPSLPGAHSPTSPMPDTQPLAVTPQLESPASPPPDTEGLCSPSPPSSPEPTNPPPRSPSIVIQSPRSSEDDVQWIPSSHSRASSEAQVLDMPVLQSDGAHSASTSVIKSPKKRLSIDDEVPKKKVCRDPRGIRGKKNLHALL